MFDDAKKSIRVKVTLMLIAIVIVVTSVHVGMSLLAMQDRLTETVKKNATVIADVGDKLILTHLELIDAEAKIVAEKLATLPDSEIETLLKNTMDMNANILSFTVFDRDKIVVSYGNYPAPNSLLHSSRFLPKAFAGQRVISSTYWDKLTERLVMYVYIPIDNNRVLAATIPGTFFSDLISDIRIWKTGNIFIIDDQGVMIANMRDHYVNERVNFIERAKTYPDYKDVGNIFLEMIHGQNGFGRFYLDGVERLCVWKKVTGSTMGWTLGVEVPLNESPVAQAQLRLLLSGLAFMILGIFVVVFISGKVARPFKMIEEQNKNLVALNKEVKAATEAKSNFLANVSHEMRTPMNAIIGLSELMLGEDELQGEVRERLNKVYSAGVTLLGIVNDLLDISKIESKRFELVPETYDLPSFINDTVALNIMRIAEKPIEFKLLIDGSLPDKLIGDDLRVKQICNNLLSNAFKYTREGTVEWRLSCERDGDSVWMTCAVTDTGIGIKPNDIGKLFSNYSQVDTRSNRKIEGTGLGLALARYMVEMMDGNITVESEYGKGSTFTARFRQKFVSDVMIDSNVVESLKKMHYSKNRLETKTRFIRVQLPYARVLVVDDVPTNLDVARGMLKPYGMKVDCVDSGQKAVDLIKKRKIIYDAIFMDHMMPEMDGIEAVRIIRSRIGTDYAKTIPVIAMTANAIAGNEEMFLNNGFQAFIAKPIDIMLLDSVIRHWIRDKSMESRYVDQQVKEKEQKIPDSDLRQKAQKKKHTGTERRSGHVKQEFDKATPPIPGLDLEECLGRFSGDEETLRDILDSYVRNTPVMLEKIRTVTQEMLDDYAVIAHGIKGSSRNICAQAVGDFARELEYAAKAGDFAFVETKNSAFQQAVKEQIAQISNFLKHYSRA
ncbi:MAG: response regulator [Azoarcus sp.]|jgi:signal transduction histidine kinase/CheY-like chemotaxis protein/HPt (histidine-containing phosphotransfer) domain-containing protein|nr:response regulator [Azoarcus sp.]